MFILRLDDASDKMNLDKWNRMERLLDLYSIKPLVAVIPNCLDETISYENNEHFFDLVKKWEQKGWTIGLHGYDHVLRSSCGGLNPVNDYSEFVGLPYEKQLEKIKNGLSVMNNFGVNPKVFVAPAHGFDENTLEAIKTTSIRVISDTIASNSYTDGYFTFVPLQSGKVRNLHFKIVSFCYHPNNMTDCDFKELESFLVKYKNKFIPFPLSITNRKRSFFDRLLGWLYFTKRRIAKLKRKKK